MMDVVVDYINQQLRKDSVAVMIQAHDGAQYIVDRNHFVTKTGKTIAQKGHLELISRAAKRVIRFLDKKVVSQDYVVFKPRNLGPNRTHFVVWFPSENSFKVDDEKWRGHLVSVAQEDIFDQRQLRAVKYVAKEAIKLHKQRQEITGTMSILMEH